MDFKEVLNARVSCRKYNGKKVPDEVVEEILNEMTLAPTAGHKQAYKVRVVKDTGFIEKAGVMIGQEDRFRGATLMLIFFADPAASSERFGERGEKFFCVQDATIACAYAQMAAANLGVSSLWVGAFKDDALMELCGMAGAKVDAGAGEGVGAGLRPVSVSLFGYTDEKLERSARKDLKDVLID